METVGVGTRKAIPLNLPLSCGNTRLTAFAAPVVVGMMFKDPHAPDGGPYEGNPR